MNTFREWMKDRFTKERLYDMAQHGCKVGFAGLHQYWETSLLYERYKNEIWDILNNEAKHQKLPVLTVLWQSNKVNNQGSIANVRSFECACVWAAAQILARGRPKKRWFVREVRMDCEKDFVVFMRSSGCGVRYFPTCASMERLRHEIQRKILLNEGVVYVNSSSWRWVA